MAYSRGSAQQPPEIQGPRHRLAQHEAPAPARSPPSKYRHRPAPARGEEHTPRMSPRRHPRHRSRARRRPPKRPPERRPGLPVGHLRAPRGALRRRRGQISSSTKAHELAQESGPSRPWFRTPPSPTARKSKRRRSFRPEIGALRVPEATNAIMHHITHGIMPRRPQISCFFLPHVGCPASRSTPDAHPAAWRKIPRAPPIRTPKDRPARG